uniref:Uncharacterized protein n=1 Tax=Timema poppense TaxID=170557 RepID=A0A7R9D8Y9_TIMPO|nr:unnamed protein product [Timema poppensis]
MAIHKLVLQGQCSCDPTSRHAMSSSPSADLVPTLLGMYDALIGRAPNEGAAAAPKQPPPRLMESVVFSRPLSVSSIASSSSSSSSGTSSCSGGGRRLGAAPKSSAYLASIESLEDDSEEEARLKCSQGRQPYAPRVHLLCRGQVVDCPSGGGLLCGPPR